MATYREVQDARKGRCAVASVHLHAGACVLRTSSLCAVSSSSCGYCFTPQGPLSRCTGCRIARYCSRTCQQRDWPQHRHECAAWRSIPAVHALPTVLLVSRLAARVFLASEGDEDERNRVLKLRDHLEDHSEDKRRQYHDMAQLVLLLLSRYKAEKSESVKSFEELQNLLEDEILKLFGRVNCNAFSVANDVTNSAVGIGLFPEGALFNHDCDPNCVVSFKGREMQVHAVKNVLVDEELTVSYVELLQSTRSRRNELKDSYFFDCECERCLAAMSYKTKDDWYLDGLKCRNVECNASGGVVVVENDGSDSVAVCKCCGCERDIKEITRYEQKLESIRVVKAASEEATWKTYQSKWDIMTSRLRLHPRNARIALVAREIGNFLLNAKSPELQFTALPFLLAELRSVEWLLPKTKLPSRGLLHFQIGKLLFEEVDAPLSTMPPTSCAAQIQQAAKHLQEALSVLDCTYGSGSVAVQSAQLMLDEIQRAARQFS